MFARGQPCIGHTSDCDDCCLRVAGGWLGLGGFVLVVEVQCLAVVGMDEVVDMGVGWCLVSEG